MVETEALDLIEHMSQLWTTWKHTDAQVDLWVKVLKPHEYDVAKHAIDAAWTVKNYGKPDPNTILAKIRAAEPQTDPERSESPDPHRHGVYIICVCVDDAGGGRPGWFVPIIPAPCQDLSPDRLVEIAQAWAVSHAAQYGGIWEVMQGVTIPQMVERSSRVRVEMANLEAASV